MIAAVSCALLGAAAAPATQAQARQGLTADFLREAAGQIRQGVASAGAAQLAAPTEPVAARGRPTVHSGALRPTGASASAGERAISVQSDAPPVLRGEPKMAPEATTEEPARAAGAAPGRRLSFSSGSFTPAPGIDERLRAAVAAGPSPRAANGAGERFTYAFALTTEHPSREMADELAALGVDLLGAHDDAVKLKLPLSRQVLEELIALPYVEWVGYARPEQKVDAALQQALASFADQVERFPLIVTLFEDDADGRFGARLRQIGLELGRYDPELQTYRAAASPAAIDALIALDFVMFVEVERPTGPGHDQSMATLGVDYIRPGGAGRRFGGDPTILGIMDTGFMLGAAAAATHFDLNKHGCGRNFTTDAANEWNDEHGHGTHVLGTIVGTGAGDARLRGVAPGVGESATTPIRAAKVWGSDNSGQTAWMESAIDFMGEASSCGSSRPLVVNLSGGATASGLTGTDSLSRKVDDAVWSNRQAYIVCGGNTGPGAQTIWTPGVAKNALAVGNVLDHGFETVGELNAFAGQASSLGPTGDGRMKPNLVATGTEVTSAAAGTSDGYQSMSGCSMATPHVSGIAATLMEHYPSFRNRPHLLRAHLMATALLHDDAVTPASNSAGGRNDYGMGRVSSYLAHWARRNANGWISRWAWRDVSDRNWAYYDLKVPRGAARLVVVMTWDEPPASAGAARAVTYDLDLWADAGADCEPDAKGQCGEWASQSDVDNTEYLIIDDPQPGIWRLKITNWRAPSFELPAAIATTVLRGDPTPAMTLSASPSTTDPAVGSSFTVRTRAFSPSYVAAGVHLALTGLSDGLRFLGVTTRREDGGTSDFGATRELTLGDIVERDSRTAVWTFQVLAPGSQTIDFRAWSENGGTRTARVSLAPGTS